MGRAGSPVGVIILPSQGVSTGEHPQYAGDVSHNAPLTAKPGIAFCSGLLVVDQIFIGVQENNHRCSILAAVVLLLDIHLHILSKQNGQLCVQAVCVHAGEFLNIILPAVKPGEKLCNFCVGELHQFRYRAHYRNKVQCLHGICQNRIFFQQTFHVGRLRRLTPLYRIVIKAVQKMREGKTAPVLQFSAELTQYRTVISGGGLEAVIRIDRSRLIIRFPILNKLLLQLCQKRGLADAAHTVIHHHLRTGKILLFGAFPFSELLLHLMVKCPKLFAGLYAVGKILQIDSGGTQNTCTHKQTPK